MRIEWLTPTPKLEKGNIQMDFLFQCSCAWQSTGLELGANDIGGYQRNGTVEQIETREWRTNDWEGLEILRWSTSFSENRLRIWLNPPAGLPRPAAVLSSLLLQSAYQPPTGGCTPVIKKVTYTWRQKENVYIETTIICGNRTCSSSAKLIGPKSQNRRQGYPHKY